MLPVCITHGQWRQAAVVIRRVMGWDSHTSPLDFRSSLACCSASRSAFVLRGLVLLCADLGRGRTRLSDTDFLIFFPLPSSESEP